MIELGQDQLTFRFPEIHPGAWCTIDFQRTLRIPDDNRTYYLPPGLGHFPLMHVDDLGERLPDSWKQHGGIFFPMYQSEAMWISFNTSEWSYPFAVKVAAGKINAVTGDSWTNRLHQDPQDYLVISEQPWLDGFTISKGKIRQFVAMPLGQGYTAEEQITGEAEHGGIQIIVYPMKEKAFQEILAKRRPPQLDIRMSSTALFGAGEGVNPEMGLAAGGVMWQEVYEDPYGLDSWDQEAFSRCYVHIANSEEYQKFTGKTPPTRPPTSKAYTDAGLPWFDYYAENLTALSGSETLSNLDSVAAKGIKKGEIPYSENEPVEPRNVHQLGQDRFGGQGW